MKNIIVVEALSTGRNYVDDIAKLGYNPVVLEQKPYDDEALNEMTEEERHFSYSRIKSKF